jgi:hypothetical protein
VAQPVEIVGVLVATRDGEGARCDQLEHPMLDAALIATIEHGASEPPADAKPPLGFPQQQLPCIRRLVAALEIDCELLALDGWQIKGEQRIVGHGGCGAA